MSSCLLSVNLFNLLPLMQLDGGHAFRALSKWERAAITALMLAMWITTHEGLLLLLAAVAAFRIFQKDAPAQRNTSILLEFAFLVIALSLLSKLPVEVDSQKSGSPPSSPPPLVLSKRRPASLVRNKAASSNPKLLEAATLIPTREVHPNLLYKCDSRHPYHYVKQPLRPRHGCLLKPRPHHEIPRHVTASVHSFTQPSAPTFALNSGQIVKGRPPTRTFGRTSVSAERIS